jgi:hypothetical protein
MDEVVSEVDIPEFLIPLRHETGNEVAGMLCIDRDDFQGNCTVTLRSPVTEATATDSDAFDAFCQIRKLIERQGWRAICYGASLNCWCGGFCRSMANGRKVYRLTMGQHTTTNDVLGTFESGPDVIPATFAEQERYFEQWLQSPKPPFDGLVE